jgi:predicted O-methyltransferase YrrM
MYSFNHFHTQRMEEVKNAVRPIPGWLLDEGAENLYQLALTTPVPLVVELGSWQGKSAVCLAMAMRDRGEGIVYAVDTWQGSNNDISRQILKSYKPDQLWNEFNANIRRSGVANLIKPIRKMTADAARQWDGRQIGLLYIDAGHDYEEVKQDFELWSPYVASGGFIVFDDVPSWEGPTRFIEQLPPTYQMLAIRANHAIFLKL